MNTCDHAVSEAVRGTRECDECNSQDRQRPDESRVTDKVRPVRRSAGFQPGVSPISNRQNVAVTAALGLSGHPQAGSTAIQQVGNLRCDFVHGPADERSLAGLGEVSLLALHIAAAGGRSAPGAWWRSPAS